MAPKGQGYICCSVSLFTFGSTLLLSSPSTHSFYRGNQKSLAFHSINGEAMERDRIDKTPPRLWWRLCWRVCKSCFYDIRSIIDPFSICGYHLLLCRWNIQRLNQSLRSHHRQLCQWWLCLHRRVWGRLWRRLWWMTIVYSLITITTIISTVNTGRSTDVKLGREYPHACFVSFFFVVKIV